MKQSGRLHLMARVVQREDHPFLQSQDGSGKVPETSSWDDHIALSGCQHKQNEELMQLSKYLGKKLEKKTFLGGN